MNVHWEFFFLVAAPSCPQATENFFSWLMTLFIMTFTPLQEKVNKQKQVPHSN